MMTTVLCAYWGQRPLSAVQYVTVIKSYVDGLERLSNVFSEMLVLGSSRSTTEKPGSSMENWLRLTIANQPKDWAFVTAEGKKSFACPEAWTRNGFQNTFATTLNPDAPGAVVQTTLGSTDADSINVLIVRLRGPEAANLDLLRKLFEYTVTSWEPAYGCLTIEEPGSQPEAVDLDEIPLGWLTYSANEKLSGSVPQGILAERVGPGVLIEVPGGHAPAQNTEFKKRLLNLRESLREAGLLADPLAS